MCSQEIAAPVTCAQIAESMWDGGWETQDWSGKEPGFQMIVMMYITQEYVRSSEQVRDSIVSDVAAFFGEDFLEPFYESLVKRWVRGESAIRDLEHELLSRALKERKSLNLEG